MRHEQVSESPGPSAVGEGEAGAEGLRLLWPDVQRIGASGVLHAHAPERGSGETLARQTAPRRPRGGRQH
jgi:hypothetical protein